ncbi:CRISPR-associated helicase Cas3' [Micromonospora sp. CMU55-4]|uniref:CRISPR-associated helicase Cas3' n=1 Tax=Micromonospora sp. CMU55-4 TaxID=2717028 RepID=UPI00140C4F31|nr:CRISPR-associated helicase Cas3' [Micromonospora sp. CMU55-4]NHO79436.1 CRISPR-associated helicase Cas3' [Micromonospora sp. CMU55-4]
MIGLGFDHEAVDAGIWGKSSQLLKPYPLLWHLIDTAAVAGELWDRYLAPNQRRVIAEGLGTSDSHAKSLVMFWAGLHDVGKVSPGFQKKNEAAFGALLACGLYEDTSGDGSLRHDAAGQLCLPDLLGPLGYSQSGRRVSSRPVYRVAQVVGGHHGRFQQTSGPHSGRQQLGEGGWARQRAAFVRVVHEAVGCPEPPPTVTAPASVLVTGLVILADWLASQEHFLVEQSSRVPQRTDAASALAHLAALAAPVRTLLDDAGLVAPLYRSAGFEDLFPHRPNALQRSILDEVLPVVDGPGLMVVTAATGDGKTEAALVAARRLAEVCGAHGFFFALPTMATSDEMYRRVRAFAAKLAAGPAPVTLLHSMSWLNAEYEARAAADLADPGEVVSDDPSRDVMATDWLRGRKRGLLAPMAVGTVDQALLAALTTKHNALRLLGLSGKVFVVDEAHAYDEYMTTLLCQLLNWLGAYGCPVVLLSATLPSSQAATLVRAYEKGAGVERSACVVPYPGWTFVPAAQERDPLSISPQAREALVAGRSVKFTLDVRPVRHLDGPVSDPADRREVVRQVLAPVAEHGGCAGVVCNTVNDAQQTYRVIRDWMPAAVDVMLLHSRFPARRREEITAAITGRMGRAGDRSRPTVVVATQVIEQSLDLDFDLLVTDLAPMAQLLQRAGRCHRHVRPRPSWAEQPRVVVLDPRGADGAEHVKPAAWGDVYARYLLRATHQRLADIDTIAVPHSVQSHVEAVYAPPPIRHDQVLSAEYDEYRAGRSVERGAAELGVIPSPDEVTDLESLSRTDTPEWRASTRLGAESERVLCCYLDPDGGQWLDAERRTPLPQHGSRRDGRFRNEEVRAILQETIPVRADLIRGYEPSTGLPTVWSENAWLKEIHPLWMPITPRGPGGAVWGDRSAHLDPELGLVVTSTGAG